MSKLQIGFTGDFCPWGRIEEAWYQNTWKDAIAPVQDFFITNDYNILDLECPLTKHSEKIIKTGPHIKAIPDTAAILAYLNCRQVATANNHFKDYGWQGMQDTYNALKKEGIAWFGSGSNREKAGEPYVIEENGLKITFFNMAEHEWSIAGRHEGGCNPIDFPKALHQIQNVKEEGSDFVVVILHGGHEHYPLPSPRMKAQFRFMIDAGADAVVGHHTHVISGYELYKDKPIFYSLGNFCFDWPGLRGGTWNKGMLLRLSFEKEKLPTFEYKFIHQNDDFVGVKYMDADSSLLMEKELGRLNEIIADDKALADDFEKFTDGLSKVMLSRIQPYRNKLLVALHKRGFLPDFMGVSKRRILKILTQCESHREVLLASLNEKTQ